MADTSSASDARVPSPTDPRTDLRQFQRLATYLGVILALVAGLAGLGGFYFGEPRYRGITVVALGAMAGPFVFVLFLHWQLSHRLFARVDELTRTNAELAEAHARMHRDVTRMNEDQEWTTVLANSVPDGLLAADEDGLVKALNEAAERLTGWRRDEAIGTPFHEVLRHEPGWTLGLPADLWDATRAAGEPVSANEPLGLVSRDGLSRPVMMTAVPARRGVRDLGGVLLFRSVTTADAAGLVAQQTVAIRESLSGVAAHELCNVFTVIAGQADLLASGADAIVEPQQALSSIRNEALRGAKLTRQLLGLGRHQYGGRQPIDVAAAIREIEPILGAILAPTVTMTVRVGGDIGRIAAPPQLLEDVLTVLATSAREEMTSGELRIDASHVVVDGPFPHAPSVRGSGRYVRISVSILGPVAHAGDPRARRLFESRGAPQPVFGIAVAAHLAASLDGHLFRDTYDPTYEAYTLYVRPCAPPA